MISFLFGVIFIAVNAVGAPWDSRINAVYSSPDGVSDLRVDSNLDGKTDIWSVSRDGAEIQARDQGQKRILNISSIDKDIKTEIQAESVQGRLFVKSIKSVPVNKDALNTIPSKLTTSSVNECENYIHKKTAQFSNELEDWISRGNVNAKWNKQCSGIDDLDELKEDLSDSYVSALKLESGGSSNSLIRCLEQLKESEPPKNSEFDLLILKMKVAAIDLYEGKISGDSFSCERGKEDQISADGSGKIKIVFGDGKKLSSKQNNISGMQSALLINCGVDVETAKKIGSQCAGGKINRSNFTGSFFPADRFVPESTVQSANAIPAKIASNSELAGINKKLAETKVTIPTAEETSPMALAAIERTQGPEAAQRVARSQSSSLMNAANTVLGAVSSPAVASSRSLASNNASSNRESIKFGESVVGKRLPASALKSRGIASDETIVEEIDPSKRSRNTAAAARTKATTSAANSRSPASANGGSNGEATALSDDGGQELGRAGVSSGPSAAGNGGSRGSLLSESSSSAGPQAQGRTAARSGGATASPAREEVVSYFRNADYTQARRKLRDPSFIKILKDNNITVMDLAGNSFGATRGSTIFLDQGDRFVRQK